MITVVSPHPDDAELGASVFLRPGARILLITGTANRRKEQYAAAEEMGVEMAASFAWAEGRLHHNTDLVQAIEPLVRESDTVLCPPVADTHQDHRAVALSARSALRRSSVALMEYETPSTTAEWEPTVFVPMSEAALFRQATVLQHFRSQTDRAYVDTAWLAARARVHGMRIGATYAQAFRLVMTGTGVPFPREDDASAPGRSR